INDYTTLEARGLVGSRRRYRGSDLALRPLWTFIKLYVGKQGFRDGVEGFMFCLLSGVSAAARAWKHRELERAGPAGSVDSVAGVPSSEVRSGGVATRRPRRRADHAAIAPSLAGRTS